MSEPEKEKKKERCKWCGKEFVKLAAHTPHCEVYKLQQDADAHTQDLVIEPKNKSQEITVPGSATVSIQPDQFWAWTEGLGVQLGVVIGHLSDVREFGGNVMKLLREQLFAINSGIADQLELLQQIVDYEKLRIEMMSKVETKIEEIVEPKATFKKVPVEDLAAEYDEIRQKEDDAKEVKSYKDEITLPEGTRQLKGIAEIITEKAVQISFTNGKTEVWIPKSTIHSTMKDDKTIEQTFVIDSWVLKKNGVIGEKD